VPQHFSILCVVGNTSLQCMWWRRCWDCRVSSGYWGRPYC